MGLTDDQRAMLRLLAERGEDGYADIAALKGVSVEQVRAEMKEALATAAAEREATPKAAEPASPALEPPPPPPAQAPPPVPAAPVEPPAARKPPAPRRAPAPPERRRFVLIAAGALGLVAVVLALIALIGGTSGGSSSSGEAGSAAGEGAAARRLTRAVLKPASGQSGEGLAIFGRVGKEEIVLQVAAQNLEPSKPGQSYTVWLYRSPKVSLRVGSAKVAKAGRLGVQLPIPTELLAYVAAGAFKQIYVSRTDDTAYEREVARAKKEKALPAYAGETVLTGEIVGPILKQASGEKR